MVSVEQPSEFALFQRGERLAVSLLWLVKCYRFGGVRNADICLVNEKAIVDLDYINHGDKILS